MLEAEGWPRGVGLFSKGKTPHASLVMNKNTCFGV